MEKENYRIRIYKNYLQGRALSLAPDSIVGLRPRAPYLQRIINRHFPNDKNASVLDLGCGHGAILFFAREAGYTNLQGIDSSPEQIEAARRLGIENVKEGDLMQTLTSLTVSSQDCIVTFDVIEHFSREELIPLVDEVFRVLQPGGSWIIHTPNGESPFSGRMRYWDLTHELAFTRTSIAQLLLSSGFGEVKSYEDEPVPHGVKSAGRWLLWKMIRSIFRLYLVIETGDSGKNAIFTQNFLTIAVK